MGNCCKRILQSSPVYSSALQQQEQPLNWKAEDPNKIIKDVKNEVDDSYEDADIDKQILSSNHLDNHVNVSLEANDSKDCYSDSNDTTNDDNLEHAFINNALSPDKIKNDTINQVLHPPPTTPSKRWSLVVAKDETPAQSSFDSSKVVLRKDGGASLAKAAVLRAAQQVIEEQSHSPYSENSDSPQNGIPQQESINNKVEEASSAYRKLKSNSTSTLFISSTITAPDVDELVRTVSIALHHLMQKSVNLDYTAQKKFEIFEENTHPLTVNKA